MSSITFSPTISDRTIAFLQNAEKDRGFYVFGSSIGKVASTVLPDSFAAIQMTKDFSQGLKLLSIPYFYKESLHLIQTLDSLIFDNQKKIMWDAEFSNILTLIYDLCNVLTILSEYHVINCWGSYFSAFTVTQSLIILASQLIEIGQITKELVFSDVIVSVEHLKSKKEECTDGFSDLSDGVNEISYSVQNKISSLEIPFIWVGSKSFSVGCKNLYLPYYFEREVKGTFCQNEQTAQAIVSHILNHQAERLLALSTAVSLVAMQVLTLSAHFFAYAASPYVMPLLGVSYLVASLSKGYYNGFMQLEVQNFKDHAGAVSFGEIKA